MATSHDSPYRHYLKEWREHRGWLQSDLGQKVGVDGSVISRYETGERRIHLEMQFKLMAALGITPTQFFSPPDQPSLDTLLANTTPRQRRYIDTLIKAVIASGDPE